MRVREVVADAATGETVERWVDIPGVLTVEEAALVDAQRRADEARAERNRRLAACDWTTLSDAPLSAAQAEEWLTYREALRAVPEQKGFPDAIQWPVAPGGVRLMG